ncbi:MAG TPA: permease, partial [Rhodanobacter sp.]|nr:permease [Rhodanobacter sp.]
MIRINLRGKRQVHPFAVEFVFSSRTFRSCLEVSMDMRDQLLSTSAPAEPAAWRAWLAPVLFVIAWAALYSELQPATDAFMRQLPIAAGTHLWGAVSFFAFEVPKVLMLLALIVFVVGVIQTFFTPEKTRAILARQREGVGNALAASLGIVTPFCSCSAVPLFIG